jgi:hypothetical protein
MKKRFLFCLLRFLLLRKYLMNILGIILIVFAIADFGLSFMGVNLTPFLPAEISRFSPIAFGIVGTLLMNMSKS